MLRETLTLPRPAPPNPRGDDQLKLTHLFAREVSSSNRFLINLAEKATPEFVDAVVKEALGHHCSAEPVKKLRNEVFVHVGDRKGKGRCKSTIEREAAATAPPGDSSATTFVLLTESQKATYAFDGRESLSSTSNEPRRAHVSAGSTADVTQVVKDADGERSALLTSAGLYYSSGKNDWLIAEREEGQDVDGRLHIWAVSPAEMLATGPPFCPPHFSGGKDGLHDTTSSPRGCSLGLQHGLGGESAGSVDVRRQLSTVLGAPAVERGGVGRSCGGGVEAAKIVDFTPRWDFPAGGEKLLILLETPMGIEAARQGPTVYFGDRPVQPEMVSPSTLRCKVPPGPGIDGTGRVTIRVGGPSPVLSRGRQQGIAGVDEFEYRCINSQPNPAAATSRGGVGNIGSPLPDITSLLSAAAVTATPARASTPRLNLLDWSEVSLETVELLGQEANDAEAAAVRVGPTCRAKSYDETVPGAVGGKRAGTSVRDEVDHRSKRAKGKCAEAQHIPGSAPTAGEASPELGFSLDILL